MNKAFFYVWCFMALCGFVASFFNPDHLWFTLFPSVVMALAFYPDCKAKEEIR